MGARLRGGFQIVDHQVLAVMMMHLLLLVMLLLLVVVVVLVVGGWVGGAVRRVEGGGRLLPLEGVKGSRSLQMFCRMNEQTVLLLLLLLLLLLMLLMSSHLGDRTIVWLLRVLMVVGRCVQL